VLDDHWRHCWQRKRWWGCWRDCGGSGECCSWYYFG